MRASHAVLVATAVVFLSTTGIACHDSTAPAAQGTIQVTVSSTGNDVDPDGYLVSVDSRLTQTVTTSTAIAFTGLAVGNHSVRLGDLASNCTVAGDNPRSVSVVAEGTVTAGFSVDCISRTGSVRITIRTNGSALDPDGYRLSMDGGPEQILATNGELTLTDIHEGSHRLTLSGVASNCTLSGGNERTVTVLFAGVTQSEFSIACHGTGTLEVTAATTGTDLDPDGYTVNVYSDDYYGPWYSATVPTNGSVTMPNIEVGNYSIVVEGRAANCEVIGSNPPGIVIRFGQSTSASVNIHCFGKTTLEVKTATTGVDLDPDGYMVTVASYRDGRLNHSVTVPTNGSVSLTDIVGGRYLLNASGWAANCEFVGTNPHDIVVDDPGPTSTSLNFVCLPVRRLAFADSGDIYTVNSNGTEAVRLTTNTATNEDPAWSPDASKIAFATNRDGVFRIYIMNADGSEQRPLTINGDAAGQPAWSPDGQMIAFVRGRDANSDIYVMKADGTGVVQLTQTAGFDGDPAWSPDGRRIAFRSDRSGSAELYLMNADGSSVTRLTTTAMNEGEPAWSPDGAKIVFTGQECDYYYGCYSVLFVMNADGTHVSQLVSRTSSSPAWSPDGSWIAFVESGCGSDVRCEGGRLSMVKADGTGGGTIRERRATQPAWRP